MGNTITITDYSIQTLQNEHIKSTLELFIKTFCDNEPITKHLGIHYKDYEPFARDVLQKAIKDGMSKVILNKEKKVIAFAIAEDIADPFVPHISHYPKLRPIVELLHQLSKPFFNSRVFQKNKVLHIWLAAVDTQYRGQGLSTGVDMACIENAAKRGFDYAYAEFTNELSENVTHQFKIIKKYNTINFDDFVSENNSKPFSGLPGKATAYLAAIRPGVKLEAIQSCYLL